MVLLTNEQGNCQLYDVGSGILQHEFIFDQAFGSKKKQGDQKKKKKSVSGEQHGHAPLGGDSRNEQPAASGDLLAKGFHVESNKTSDNALKMHETQIQISDSTSNNEVVARHATLANGRPKTKARNMRELSALSLDHLQFSTSALHERSLEGKN